MPLYHPQPRQRILSNRTYFVRTDGSDSNNGSANTSGFAFLTLQKAWDEVSKLDLNGFAVQISIADGTYTSGVLARSGPVGQGAASDVSFVGNGASPQNVIVSVSAATATCFKAGEDEGGMARFHVQGLEMRTSGSAWDCISATNGGSAITFTNVRFGSCARYHIDAHHCAYVKATGNYAVVGSAQAAIFSASGAIVVTYSVTVTYANSPAFSVSNFLAAAAQLYCASITFVNGGTVTGPRYFAGNNGVVDTGGGGASYVPGNSVGSTSNGGQYI